MDIIDSHDPAAPGVITRVEDLEGWCGEGGLFSTLLQHVFQAGTFFLYGERFSGKTSLLKSLQYELKARYPSWIPVFINFQANLSGSHDSLTSYKYILLTIYNELSHCAKEGAPWTLEELDKIFRPSNTTSFFNAPEDNLFKALSDTESLMKKNMRHLLLMFDDAENLPCYFQGREDKFFYPFRGLRDSWEKSTGGITCVLASAQKISFFEHHTGSPQFNNIGYEIPVPPLDEATFCKFWNKLLTSCSDNELDNLRKHVPDAKTAYELCGGRPGFAKDILNIWRHAAHSSDKNPLEHKLRNIYERQTAAARKYLIDVALRNLPEDESCARELKDFYLVEDEVPEIGGTRIRGRLWREFLQAQGSRDMEFTNAGEFARHILATGRLEALLGMREGKGELGDWLEFKAVLIPTKGQMEADRKEQEAKSKRQVEPPTEADYVWHVLKAVIALHNTRGGLVLIGVKDNGEIMGISGPLANKGDEDMVREIKKKLGKEKMVGAKYTCSPSNLDLDNSESFAFQVTRIGEKKIVAIAVHPGWIDIADEGVLVQQWVTGHDKFTRNYIILRQKNAENMELAKDDKYFKQKIAEHRQSFMDNSDLTALWKKLL